MQTPCACTVQQQKPAAGYMQSAQLPLLLPVRQHFCLGTITAASQVSPQQPHLRLIQNLDTILYFTCHLEPFLCCCQPDGPFPALPCNSCLLNNSLSP